MLIIRLEQQILILEKSWMRKHEISYYEKTNIMKFFSEFCIYSKRIKTSSSNKEKNISFEKKFFLNQLNHSKFDDSIRDSRKSKKIVIKIFSRKEVCFDQSIDQSANRLSRKDEKSTNFVNKKKILKTIKDFELIKIESEISHSKEKKSLFEMNIAMIEAFVFNMMNKRKNVSLFFVILKNVEKHFEKHNKSNIVIKDVLSFEYHKFLNVFDKKAFNIFASHRSYDLKIVLEKNAISKYTSLYKMFEEKLKIVKKYLENNLKKKFIAANRSSFVSFVMFMKKTNESLKFCVDYKKLNQLTKKNKYSLFFIDETLTYLKKIKYFTKLNIRQTFHRIEIAHAE